MAFFAKDGSGRGGMKPARFANRYLHNRRGNVAEVVALMIVPLERVLRVATEATNWFMAQRAMQNAADSAALAAALNGSANPNGTTHLTEAKSVTGNFGF